MGKKYVLDNFRFMPVETDREFNFSVMDQQGYICRLVPYEDGFDISPVDKALGITITRERLREFSDFILDQDA